MPTAETDINFDIVITAEGITLARESQLNPGWYLIPKRWACSNTRGELSSARTTATMNDTWTSNAFSGVTASGTNGLLHTIVFGPQESPTEAGERIDEIYFIYEDHNGSEFLYAVAQPRGQYIQYNWGISQTFSFLFTLNNSTVDATFEINYTFPQDIEDHNNNRDAHSWLLDREGTRTATGILKYNGTKKFTSDYDIPYKKYVDDLIEDEVIKRMPTGAMMWWPTKTPPSGWLIRNGSPIRQTSYPELYNLLYNSGIRAYRCSDEVVNGVTYKRVYLPDDRAVFIRGFDYNGGYSYAGAKTFYDLQPSCAPNCRGYVMGDNTQLGTSWETSGQVGPTGVFYRHQILRFDFSSKGDGNQGGILGFNLNGGCQTSTNQNWNSSFYIDGMNEFRPVSRCYLPIIKA